MPVPNWRCGSLGSCGAPTSALWAMVGKPAASVTAMPQRAATRQRECDIAASGRRGSLGLCGALRNERVVFVVVEVHDVHPRVSHLVDRAIAVAHPLIGIRVELVGLRVV